MNALVVDMQIAVDPADDVPGEEAIHAWVAAALDAAGRTADTELTVRVVDDAESAELNGQYRGKHGPTNVLSFPFETPPGLDALPLIGDLVVCAPVVSREAAEQSKPLAAHWAHMVVHGTLHLLGYDHMTDADAEVMERLETAILARFSIADPYQEVMS